MKMEIMSLILPKIQVPMEMSTTTVILVGILTDTAMDTVMAMDTILGIIITGIDPLITMAGTLHGITLPGITAIGTTMVGMDTVAVGMVAGTLHITTTAGAVVIGVAQIGELLIETTTMHVEATAPEVEIIPAEVLLQEEMIPDLEVLREHHPQSAHPE